MQNNSRLWIGLGFQGGASPALIAAAIHQVCWAHGFDETLIIGLATLDSKAASLIKLCAERQWRLRGFSAAQLQAVPIPNPAAQVMAAVATPSVAEAAAILAAGSPLCLCKQIIRQSGEPAVTLAAAESRLEA